MTEDLKKRMREWIKENKRTIDHQLGLPFFPCHDAMSLMKEALGEKRRPPKPEKEDRP